MIENMIAKLMAEQSEATDRKTWPKRAGDDTPLGEAAARGGPADEAGDQHRNPGRPGHGAGRRAAGSDRRRGVRAEPPGKPPGRGVLRPPGNPRRQHRRESAVLP